MPDANLISRHGATGFKSRLFLSKGYGSQLPDSLFAWQSSTNVAWMPTHSSHCTRKSYRWRMTRALMSPVTGVVAKILFEARHAKDMKISSYGEGEHHPPHMHSKVSFSYAFDNIHDTVRITFSKYSTFSFIFMILPDKMNISSRFWNTVVSYLFTSDAVEN